MDSTHHSSLSTGFSRQEYWSGLPFPSPRDLPNSGVELGSPAFQVDSLPDEPQGKPKNTGVGRLSLLHDPGIESGSPAWQGDSLPTELSGTPAREKVYRLICYIDIL